jgi:tetratricopeptide (TPR) repeat protein
VSRARTAPLRLAGAVSLLTFCAFLPSLRNDFVDWDDGLYVFSNPHIRSLDGALLRWAFLAFHADNWHPLTWLSHALDYAVWGANPLGHHLTSVLLHAANAFLVVLVAHALLAAARERGDKGKRPALLEEGPALVAATVTGLLFGIHPLHVESVAWVSERKDLLCGLFFLLALHSYARRAAAVRSATASGGLGTTAPGASLLPPLGWFVLALLSKPMAVSLPLVLLILDWRPFGRFGSRQTARHALAEKVPFLALALASSVITVLAQRAGGALQTAEVAPWSIRPLVAARAVVAYLGKMLWPADLSPFYPYPAAASITSPAYLLPLLLVAGATAAAVLLAKRQGLWLALWGYYVVTLLPVLGLVQVGEQAMADRYTYLPSGGPFLLAGLGAAWTVELVRRRTPSKWAAHGAIAGLGALLAVPLLVATERQIGVWKDGVVLWDTVIARGARHPSPYYNRALALGRRDRFEEALRDLDRALELKPHFAEAHVNRGIFSERLGRLDAALAAFDRGIELDPRDYQAYVNRGLLQERRGRLDLALEDYSRAIALAPTDERLLETRGDALEKRGDHEGAIRDYDAAIALQPLAAAPYRKRGVARGKAGDRGGAVEDFDRALARDPADAEAYLGRGTARALGGQTAEARADFTAAIALDPRNAVAHANRGRLALRAGDPAAARGDLRRACELGDTGGCEALRGLAGR